MNAVVEPRCKADRLDLAAATAPRIRRAVHLRKLEAKAPRKIALTDKDGNVVGYRTHQEVVEALLLDKQIELEVEDGVRPKEILCEGCGRVEAVPKSYAGLISVLCTPCRNPKCACGASLNKSIMCPDNVKRRKGAPPACKSCRSRKAATTRTPEQRAEFRRRVDAAYTPERRSEAARKANAALSPEQRSEKARKVSEARKAFWAQRRNAQEEDT